MPTAPLQRCPKACPWQPLGWRAITMYVDPATRTIATLYGNESAMQAIVIREGSAAQVSYPLGAVLALVTWTQRDDPHWFGGRIPDRPLAVEFVQVNGKSGSSYRAFGDGAANSLADAAHVSQRTNFILRLTPASLP